MKLKECTTVTHLLTFVTQNKPVSTYQFEPLVERVRAFNGVSQVKVHHLGDDTYCLRFKNRHNLPILIINTEDKLLNMSKSGIERNVYLKKGLNLNWLIRKIKPFEVIEIEDNLSHLNLKDRICTLWKRYRGGSELSPSKAQMDFMLDTLLEEYPCKAHFVRVSRYRCVGAVLLDLYTMPEFKAVIQKALQ